MQDQGKREGLQQLLIITEMMIRRTVIKLIKIGNLLFKFQSINAPRPPFSVLLTVIELIEIGSHLVKFQSINVPCPPLSLFC